MDEDKLDIGEQSHPGDRPIADHARRQHGLVARWQLEQLGYGRNAIQLRLETGRLHRIYRGVYAVGHRALTRKGRWMAAVLACGTEAMLSHRTATVAWDLRPLQSGHIEVTARGRGRQGPMGVRVHNVRRLHPEDRSVIAGIPVTALPRTLLDYSEVAKPQEVRLAIESADRRGLFDLGAVEELLARSRGRRGIASLRAVLKSIRGPSALTRSELERRFLALIREAGIPEPQADVVVEGFAVDFFWPQQRLVVEVDGYEFHKSRAQFERDRHRDTKLQLARCGVVRVTEQRIRNPDELVRDVWRMLGAPPSGR